MLLKIIDIAGENEHESDYETAVDLSHWSMQSRSILFESLGGVRFIVTSRHEQVTHSYMEPDFDHLEATGKTVYLTHSDRSKDRFTEEFFISGLYIACAQAPVSASEFMMVFAEPYDNVWDIFFDDTRPHDVNRRIAAHLSCEDGRPRRADLRCSNDYDEHLVPPNAIAVSLADADIERLCDLEIHAGTVCEIELPLSLEMAIVLAEKQHAQIVNRNSEVAANNRVQAAMARISLGIHAHFLMAKEQTRLSFAEVRNRPFLV